MRVMGLDVGEKNVGVALSDPLGLTAQGVEVIPRDIGEGKLLERVNRLVQEYGVEKIVVGLPRNMDGSLGRQGLRVLEFARWLREATGLPVETWDERLTTVGAERILLAADVSRARRRKVVDKLAAALILQGYLDFYNKKERSGEN
ncbi:Holliday junction resolvase RuvX [Desulfovirgula thermocuniculi]|uniref:Holliday junction resolvase RuvX n=1 Tax=Desulfovirgula thermocuniculi TaxID=348842 RepID=UPI0004817A01|nr:Holliday junction resolvase RuvX [Desulfovirgula thermocuniculi]